jgi:hypothetical protein
VDPEGFLRIRILLFSWFRVILLQICFGSTKSFRFDPIRITADTEGVKAVLWNRNYLLRFRFRLLKSFGSGPVPTFEKLWFRFRFLLLKSFGSGPVPTFEKLWFRFRFLLLKKLRFRFYLVSCFTRKKFINFNKFMVKCE